MEGAILEAASAAWASISGLVVLVLGIFALGTTRTRPPGSMAFAGFAIVWALHVIAGHWMSYATFAFAPRAHLTYLAFLLPLPYFLVQFARSFARDGLRRGAWRALIGVTTAISLAAVGVLLLAPHLLYEGPVLFNGRVFPDWGPLFGPLAIFPFFSALGLTLFALDGARRASATARPALRHALLAAGLATFTAFSAGNNFTFYATDLLVGGGLPLAGAYAALFGALVALALVIGIRATREAFAAPSSKLRTPATIVAVATLVPFVWGALEGIIAYFLLPRFNTVGLWRLAGVTFIAYALARSRLPDLAPRSRNSIATAIGIVAAAALGGLAIGAFILFAPGTPMILLAAAVVPLAALSPSVRLARRALHVSDKPDLSDVTLARRIDTYRAAIEAALARNGLADDETFLAGLREELGITPDVHDALLCIARETMLPAPDESHPGYERLRLLGEGAHGRAWLARRRADDGLVVLKEPVEHDEAARGALLRQLKIAQRVRHPRLVAIQCIVDGPRGPFLVLDHMAGGSLADRLEHGPLAPALAARLAIDVLEGLDALHDAGVTHGDVKAANVLLDVHGRASVADFGLARSSDAFATMTMVSGQGTLSAMAPEQLAGTPASKASDVYAVGALLYRLLTGEHYLPFAGLDEPRARALVLERTPRLPHRRVPPALEATLRRALDKDPVARQPNAGTMRDEIVAALSGLEHQERGAQ